MKLKTPKPKDVADTFEVPPALISVAGKGRPTPKRPKPRRVGRRPAVKATRPFDTNRAKKARGRRKGGGKRRWYV